MPEDIEQIYKRTEKYGRIQFVEEIDMKNNNLFLFFEDKIKYSEDNKRNFLNEFFF